MSASSSNSSDVASLHFAIEEGDIDEVKLLLSKLPFDKHYFDAKNNSAAAVAIESEEHVIYELLVAKGIFLGPHEWMDEATSGQDRSRKVNLREIHRKYFNDPNLKYLANLITSSKLSHDASPNERRKHLRLITEAFEDLNGLKSIEPILKVASTSPKLRIVFDFNRDSVEFLDPVYDRNVEGLCYIEDDLIYVGAKDLKEKENRYKALGTLTHELTHFVMQLFYDNGSKPYRQGNQDVINVFSQVVVDTAAKKESEPCIKSAYDNYPESSHHSELIVRVPHLTALYMDDADKTNEVQAEFSELFDFYEKNTLVDLEQAYPLMEAKHEISELNELCRTLTILEKSEIEISSQALDGLDLNPLSNDKILFILSNCPQLTMSAVFEQVRTEINFSTSFIFSDLKSMMNKKIFGLAAKALALSTKPRLIIDCQGVVKFNEVMRIVNKLNENKNNQKVIFIIDEIFKDSCDSKSIEIVHSWIHLTRNFQQNLLAKKIEFYGTEMAIGDLLTDLNSFESIPFQDMLDDKTIVIGKNLKFETEKLIERKFLPPNSEISYELNDEDYSIEHDLDELLTVTKGHQTILISDEPGMGKSTSFKMLHSKLRQNNPTLWFVFMDLKDHFKAFQVSCLEVQKREDIAKFFTGRVLKTESFEAEIFTQMFNEDRVVLLMDGLDEICPSYKQFIFSLMKDIQKFSKNQLWISTRPHLVAELRKELNPIEFKLKPFTEANRREFFENHFMGDPNFELILEEIESFLKKLTPNYGQYHVVCNPLVMRMIVKIVDVDRSLKLSKANLFVVYDSFTEIMIERSLETGLLARKDIASWTRNSNFVEFHQQKAFLTCFGDEDYAVMREELMDQQFDHVKKPPLDKIVRIGLMFASTPENLHFIHRTFAEFYVAKFFYELIFKFTNLRAEKHLNATIEFLLQVVFNSDEFNFIRILLDNAIDSDKELTVKKFPQSSLEYVQENMNLEHFELFVDIGCCNLIEFFVLHLHPDGQKLLFSCKSPNLVLFAVEDQSLDFVQRFLNLLKGLNSDELKKMFPEQNQYGRSALSVAALKPNSEVFEHIIEFCSSFMTKDELTKLLIQTFTLKEINFEGETFGKTNILHSAIANGRHVDIIIKVLTLKLSPAQQKIMLVEETYRDGNNLLQYAVENQNFVANCESLFAFLRKVLNPENIENLLFHKNHDGLEAFDLALFNDNESIFGIMRKFYLEVLKKDKTRINNFGRIKCENWSQESSLYFQRICSAKTIVKKRRYRDRFFKRFIFFIMEFFGTDSIQKEFFLVKDDDGETFLGFAMKNLKEEDFAFLCSLLNTNDQAEILRLKNSRGECAFHSAAKLKNLERFRKIRRLYDENFNKEIFRQMIVSCDESWILDVVQCSIRMPLYKLDETFAELCPYLSDLFKGTNETERLKPFFLFADKWGRTVFMVAACGKHREFEYLFRFTKELFSTETIKEFLLLKDRIGRTAFRYSFKSRTGTTVEFVILIFEKLFERVKMQELVMAEEVNENILSNIIDALRPSLFEMYCKLLIRIFMGREQKIRFLFGLVDEYNRTVLMKAANESGYNYFLVLINVIEKLFVKEEIVEMLRQKNRTEKTAFHFAIRNNKEEIFETVKNFYFKTLGNEAMKNIISAKVDWSYVIGNFRSYESIKRLLPVLKGLFEGVDLKNIFFKLYPKEKMKQYSRFKSEERYAEIISYLKQQFSDDEEVKMFIIELES